MSATTKEPKFPDLTPIGLAFAQAITYINYQKHPDLDASARTWLIDAAMSLMSELKRELKALHLNKDDHTKLPRWALDAKEPLRTYTAPIPYLLQPYQKQFVDSFEKLLEACGLSFKVRYIDGAINKLISFEFTFPEAGLRREENETTKEFVFDADFQKKFFGALKNMKIDG